MPREGVPYPQRMLCSLKCELKNIWSALNGKLHSVNGVEGDGSGNVNIVSGDAAVVVTPDTSLNQIEISLDPSELPAAAVSSVNGQTGAVSLDDTDIPSIYRGDVNAELAYLDGQVGMTLPAAINAEATTRGNADNALQNSINTLAASLPSEAAAAVAADPTVIGLVAADADNVKLSGNQSISGVKTVTTEATGTYSSQIANSTKMKNELDAYTPMMRTTGNQTIAGTKTFTSNTGIMMQSSALTPAFMLKRTDDDCTVAPSAFRGYPQFVYKDGNDATVGYLRLGHKTDGGYIFVVGLRKTDGTIAETTLGTTS